MRTSTTTISVLGFLASIVSAGSYQVDNILDSGAELYSAPNVLNDYSPTPTPTPIAAPPSSNTQYVVVGGTAGLTYTPEYIYANVGDVVVFEFGTKNHTLTQCSFAEPCAELSGGFDSGFMPNDGTDMPTATMTVSVTTPLWFYCRQTGHCQQGMVFAINPPSTGNTFQNFKNNALGTSAATATVVSTSVVQTTTSVPPPSSPPPSTDDYSSSSSEQCQCVCNIEVSNGVPNAGIQGLYEFGGSLGQVEVPWGVGSVSTAPAVNVVNSATASSQLAPPTTTSYSSSDYSSDNSDTDSSSYTTTYTTVYSNSQSVGAIQNLGQGTVIGLGTDAADAVATSTSTDDESSDPPAATTTAATDTTDDNDDDDDNNDDDDSSSGGAVNNDAAGRRRRRLFQYAQKA